MQKLVDGKLLDLDANEIAAMEIDQANWTAQANNRNVKAQILTLETTVTQRRIREAISGADNGWLANVNSQIATLRAQL